LDEYDLKKVTDEKFNDKGRNRMDIIFGFFQEYFRVTISASSFAPSVRRRFAMGSI